MLCNVTLGWGLMQHFGHVGLATAVSVAGYVNVAILAFLTRRELGRYPRIGRTALVSTLLSLAVAGLCLLSLPLGKLVALGLIPLWAVFYIWAAWALHLPEARLFVSMIASRWARKRA